jgi:uncharacterized protein (TIGR00299 family) protein
MRTLFLDCFSGISGDMTVGALCDLGVKPSTFEWELSKLDLGDFHMHFERAKRQSVEGVKFGIHAGAVHTHEQDEDPDEHGQVHVHAHDDEHEHDHGDDHHSHGDKHEHPHAHEHSHDEADEHSHGDEHEHEHEHEHSHAEEHEHEHGHAHAHSEEHGSAGGRSYVEIRESIEQSDLSDFVKKHAVSIFHRVALAEAKIHGTPVEKVGFHEVGALDSIADIVCACVGIEELGVERICASALANGHGWVDCAHGRFPIPALATLEILKGIPVAQIDEPHEFITPTGAAIVAEFAMQFGLMPALRVEKIGYGLGLRQLSSRPNVLRAVLGESAQEDAASGSAASSSRYATDTVTQLETNLDDVSPEISGALLERLLKMGALDAFLAPVQMKKNRPGVLLTVLCEPAAANALADLIFAESTAFGLRMSDKPRLKLERRSETVATEYGPVSVKFGSDRAGRLLQVAPEFESCRAVAEAAGQPVRAVYAAALRAQAAAGK